MAGEGRIFGAALFWTMDGYVSSPLDHDPALRLDAPGGSSCGCTHAVMGLRIGVRRARLQQYHVRIRYYSVRARDGAGRVEVADVAAFGAGFGIDYAVYQRRFPAGERGGGGRSV